MLAMTSEDARRAVEDVRRNPRIRTRDTVEKARALSKSLWLSKLGSFLRNAIVQNDSDMLSRETTRAFNKTIYGIRFEITFSLPRQWQRNMEFTFMIIARQRQLQIALIQGFMTIANDGFIRVKSALWRMPLERADPKIEAILQEAVRAYGANPVRSTSIPRRGLGLRKLVRWKK